MKWWQWVLLVVVGLGVIGALVGQRETTPASGMSVVSGASVPASSSPETQPAVEVPSNDSRVTMAEYTAITTGMSEEEVFGIVGGRCEESSRSDLAGIVTVMYTCMNPGGANAILMFQDNALVQKSQFGLR